MKYFYDIGANQGQTFDWYINKHPLHDHHIVCFEPSPRHTASLLKKLRTSLVGKHSSLTVVTAALSDHTGLATLYEKTTPLSDSLYHEHTNQHVKNLPPGVTLQVPLLRLTDYIRDHTNSDDTIILKIDAEGAEFAILDDLLNSPYLLNRITRILIEWHYGKFPELIGRDRQAASALTARMAAHGINLEPWKY